MKHAVITGAADGIGRALALHAITEGYRVTGIDIDPERSADTEKQLHTQGGQGTFILADLTTQDGISSVLDVLESGPGIDLLIHNAGINNVGRFEHSNLATQHTLLDLNFLAPITLTTELLKRNQLRTGGCLTFVSSLSYYTSYPGAAVYAASKDGLAAYARCIRKPMAEQGIHVLTVFPGPTRTAHARRHSPDNSREDKRMPTSLLAQHTFNAIAARQPILTPGPNTTLFAMLGLLFPKTVERIMARTLLASIDTMA